MGGGGWRLVVTGGGVFVFFVVVVGCNVKPSEVRLRFCLGCGN